MWRSKYPSLPLFSDPYGATEPVLVLLWYNSVDVFWWAEYEVTWVSVADCCAVVSWVPVVDFCLVVTWVFVVGCCTGAVVIGTLLGSFVVKLSLEIALEEAKVVGCVGLRRLRAVLQSKTVLTWLCKITYSSLIFCTSLAAHVVLYSDGHGEECINVLELTV